MHPCRLIMNDIYRTRVIPLKTSVRPLWSVMIPVYNCAKFLPDALKSVLEQDPGSDIMQIEVTDDCSTDGDIAGIVCDIAGDRVVYYRQEKNVGHIQNFATALNHSKGRLVHLLHGDDYVIRGFYYKLAKTFENDPSLGAAFTRHIFADENGNQLGISPLEQEYPGRIRNQLETLASEQKIMTPSIVVKREVYESLGAFDERLICSEDWEMWVRIAAQFPIWYETEPLAVYRMHNNSNTGRHVRSGDDIKYTRMAINIFREYLPADNADKIASQALETYSRSAIRMAVQMLLKQDYKAVRSQLREAFRCSFRFSVFYYFIYILFKSVRKKNAAV